MSENVFFSIEDFIRVGSWRLPLAEIKKEFSLKKII
jgi:hypothetical protein